MQIVIDVNLIASQILRLPYTDLVTPKLRDWKQANDEICAPALFAYEMASVIRKSIAANTLSPGRIRDVLSTVEQFNIRYFPPTLALNENTIQWADRLHQRAAYDAQYLALSEHLNAEFWTADEKLANNARQAGAGWAHWIGAF